MKINTFLVLTITLMFAGLAHAERTPSGFDIGKCSKCHSEDRANQEIEFARLQAQPKEYLKVALQAYTKHTRHVFSATRYMSRRLDNLKLSAATLDQLADYFSKLPAAPGIPSTATNIAAGKEIYTNSCAMCHGDNAEGKDLNPRLAGQYKSFATSQIHAYQAGDIEGAEDMKEMVKGLSESDIDAVTNYLQTLN
jgi:cytochrome c553